MKLPLWRRRQREELDEEIDAHLEAAVRDRMERGESREQAEAAARREFGNVALVKEVTRQVWGWRWLDDLAQDVRFGVRQLRRNSGFTVVAVFTLGLGIGATTAIFSVVDAVLLRRLPYDEPERLVKVWERHTREAEPDLVAPANFIDWQTQNRSFAAMAAYATDTAALIGGDDPEQVSVAPVSADFFPLLGTRPVLGRIFLPEEDRPGRDDVAIVSHALWQRRFGSDPGLIGRVINLDEEPYTVVGVLPPGFQFPERAHVWVPLALRDNQLATRGAHFLEVLARLKPESTLEQARSEMTLIARRLEEAYPDTNREWGVQVNSLGEEVVGKVRTGLLLLMGAVGFMLLIACVNVANLLLARGVRRSQEIAVRIALGAGRLRVARQLLTESVLLGLMGGGAGLILAWLALPLLVTLSDSLPRANEIDIDRSILAFTLIISCLAAILFGMVPVFQTRSVNINDSIKQGGRGREAVIGRRTRHVLLVVEIALALVLSVGAGLLAKSLAQLQQVELGFNPKNLLTMKIDLLPSRYAEGRQVSTFYGELFERIRTIPEVQSVGAIFMLPMGGENRIFRFRPAGLDVSPDQHPVANFRIVTTGYFRTMGIALLNGRDFTHRDQDGTPPVLVINEAMARRFWPNEDPLGKSVFVRDESAAREIVGVVRDVRHFSLDQETQPEMFVPHAQWPARSMTVVVRGAADSAAIFEALQSQVRAVDRDQPISQMATMEGWIGQNTAQRRFNTLLLTVFAGLAVALAAVGVYGVMSYLVTQRTREIAIRVALGAQTGNVFALVLGQGLRTTLIGLGVGLVGALALTHLMTRLLFEVSPADPIVLASALTVLMAASLLACYIPARRAARVDPLVALRDE